ncbi:hypothetical protein D3C72_2154770 [compost metagenome]
MLLAAGQLQTAVTEFRISADAPAAGDDRTLLEGDVRQCAVEQGQQLAVRASHGKAEAQAFGIALDGLFEALLVAAFEQVLRGNRIGQQDLAMVVGYPAEAVLCGVDFFQRMIRK